MDDCAGRLEAEVPQPVSCTARTRTTAPCRAARVDRRDRTRRPTNGARVRMARTVPSAASQYQGANPRRTPPVEVPSLAVPSATEAGTRRLTGTTVVGVAGGCIRPVSGSGAGWGETAPVWLAWTRGWEECTATKTSESVSSSVAAGTLNRESRRPVLISCLHASSNGHSLRSEQSRCNEAGVPSNVLT